jgi:hypothetical protein
MKLLHGDAAARDVSGRIGGYAATTTALEAVPPSRRVNQQLFMVEDGNTLWLFDSDSEAAASSSVLEPDTGTGRFVLMGVATGMSGVFIVSKTVGHADLTDADMQQAVDFDAALPAGALVLGGGANVTALFDNVGDTADVTFDLGFLTGDTDAVVDGGSLNAIAKVSIPRGAAVPILPGALTPSVIFDGSVNLDTLTKGAATFYIAYTLAF